MAPMLKLHPWKLLELRQHNPRPQRRRIRKRGAQSMPEAVRPLQETADPYQFLKYSVTTEHALKELETNNMLVFVVDKRADKKKIRSAVERIQTKKVNTLMRPDGTKKAYVICNLQE